MCKSQFIKLTAIQYRRSIEMESIGIRIVFSARKHGLTVTVPRKLSSKRASKALVHGVHFSFHYS